jgi:hypothetical protein
MLDILVVNTLKKNIYSRYLWLWIPYREITLDVSNYGYITEDYSGSKYSSEQGPSINCGWYCDCNQKHGTENQEI